MARCFQETIARIMGRSSRRDRRDRNSSRRLACEPLEGRLLLSVVPTGEFGSAYAGPPSVDWDFLVCDSNAELFGVEKSDLHTIPSTLPLGTMDAIMNDIAFVGWDGSHYVFYGVDGYNDTDGSYLYRIKVEATNDNHTPLTEYVNKIRTAGGERVWLNALTFDGCGNLFAAGGIWEGGDYYHHLFQIDPVTCVATDKGRVSVAGTPHWSAGDLAFSRNGTLYLTTTTDLLRISNVYTSPSFTKENIANWSNDFDSLYYSLQAGLIGVQSYLRGGEPPGSREALKINLNQNTTEHVGWITNIFPPNFPNLDDVYGAADRLRANPTNADFGDAPDDPSNPNDYPTLVVNQGACHRISSLYLGAGVDSEDDGRPDPHALGDSRDNGVVFDTALIPGNSAQVTVTASSGGGNLYAWIDWNGNSTWEPSEQIFATPPVLTAGANILSFAVPAGATLGSTFARFRLSTDSNLGPGGFAMDGEVEDYEVSVVPSNLAPTITSLSNSPNPVTQPSNLTLTANGVSDSDGSVVLVEFYRDSNGNGALDPGTDQLLGTDGSSSGGWKWTGPTGGFPTGINRYFARAQDDDGAWSNVVTTTGTVLPPPDTTPPTPNPSTWFTKPHATGTTSIRMVATTASDPSQVEYYFDETSGNAGGTDSGWQDDNTYLDDDLSPDTAYTYQVKTRDKSPNQNMGSYTASESATTDPETTPYPDLIAYNVTVDSQTSLTVDPGQQVRVDFVVKNIGTALAGSSHSGIIWSTDASITSSDDEIGTKTTGSIDSGNTDSEYKNINIPTNATPGQTYYIGVIADVADEVTDESNESNNDSDDHDSYRAVAVRIRGNNQTPVLDAIGNKSVDEEAELTFTATASDQDPADSLTFSLNAAAVSLGMSINATTGEFSWTPSEDQGGTVRGATITVGDGNLSDSETISITVAEVNVGPVLDEIGNKSVNAEAELSFIATAADQDLPADSLTFSLDATAIALGMSITSGGEFSWTPSEAQTGTSYTATVTVSDGSLSDSKTVPIAVDEFVPTVVDLGQVDSRFLENQSLAAGSLYYRVQTTNEAFLTMEVIAPTPPESVRWRLFDANPAETTGLTPLAESTLDENGNQRIDWPAAEGIAYYFEVYGDNVDFDVRIANLLHHHAANGVVTVHGTSGEDTFEFSDAASRDVTINGVRYHFEDAQVESVTFDGGEADDTANLTSTDPNANDSAELWPDHGTFASPGVTTTLTKVESIKIDSGAGEDTVMIHDSAGDDELFARAATSVQPVSSITVTDYDYHDSAEHPTYVPTYSHSLANFEILTAQSTGGIDTAYFYDSDGDDELVARQFETVLTGNGFSFRADDFQFTHGYAIGGGDDRAELYDTPKNDRFKGNSVYARMFRGAYQRRSKFFETTVAYATAGGTDDARLFDSMSNDRLLASPTETRLYSAAAEYDLTVVSFGEVLVRAGNGFDTAEFIGGPNDDLLMLKWLRQDNLTKSPKTEMMDSATDGDTYKVTARNFDRTTARGGQGGYDIAKFWDTLDDDRFVADGDTAAMYSPENDLRYDAVAFDKVKFNHINGGNDKTEKGASYDFILDEFWGP